MKASRVLAAVATLGTAFAFAVAVPGTALASASHCNPNPLQDANECTTVIGSGLYVDSISGVTFNNLVVDIPNLRIRVYGPGNKTFTSCGKFTLKGPFLKGPVCLWKNPKPHVKMPAGDYCTQVAQRSRILSTECVGVHA